MFGQESFPLGVPAPQERRTDAGIHEAEEHILQYKKDIAHSQALIEELREKLAVAEFNEQRESLTAQMRKEAQVIENLTDLLESSAGALANLRGKLH